METVQAITGAGGIAVGEAGAIGSSETAEALLQRAVSEYGRLDVMVTNAGVIRDRVLSKMSDEDFDLVIATHVRGTFTCARAAAVPMREQGDGGRIVVIGSPAGQFGNFGQTPYAAAKAGIVAMARTWSLELARSSRHEELFFDDVVVPVEDRLGDDGAGFEIMRCNLPHERLSIAAMASAAANAAFDWTRDMLKSARSPCVGEEARRTRRTKGAVVEGLAEEALRTRRFPGIALRGSDWSRRPWAIGTALDVWEISPASRSYDMPNQVAAATNLTEPQIRLALASYPEFAEEIDAAIAENERSLAEFQRRYPTIDAIALGD